MKEVETIVAKVKIANNKQFFPLSRCFRMPSAALKPNSVCKQEKGYIISMIAVPWYYKSQILKNILENRTIADNEKFLLYTQCFQTRFKWICSYSRYLNVLLQTFIYYFPLSYTFWITCNKWMIMSNFALHLWEEMDSNYWK